MKKQYNRNSFWFMGGLIFFVMILGIGYASVGNIVLSIDGDVETAVQDGVFITSVECIESNGSETEKSVINDFYGTMLNSTICLDSGEISSSMITYAITVYNNTLYSYSYCRHQL